MKTEDADRDGEELDDERADDQLAGGERVDRARDDLRHEQVQRVGGDREADDRGDKGRVRLQQSRQRRRRRVSLTGWRGQCPGCCTGCRGNRTRLGGWGCFVFFCV